MTTMTPVRSTPPRRRAHPARLLLVALLLALLAPLHAPAAAAGDNDLLDPAFGDGFGDNGSGVVRLANAGYYSVALAPDGKIVVGGAARGNYWVARYLANGERDTSFGNAGEQVLQIGADAFLSTVAVQPDRRIVLAGSDGNDVVDRSDFVVARLTEGGELDASFGQGGIVRTNFDDAGITGTRSVDTVSGMALQPDGKIVVTGAAEDCSTFACKDGGLAAARYLPDGRLDSSFSSDGKEIGVFDGYFLGHPYARGYSMALLADGGVVVAGSRLKDDYDLAISLLTPEGRDDQRFDDDGLLADSESGSALAALELPNGNLLFATASPSLVQFDRSGRKLTFGNRQYVPLSFQPSAVRLQQQRSAGAARSYILVAGERENQATLARFTLDGAPDPTFGANGSVTIPDVGPITSMTLTDDGRILALTTGRLLRLRPDGSLDRSDGLLITDVAPGREQISDLAIAPDGRLIAVGSAQVRTSSGAMVRRMFTARSMPGGWLDMSFDRDGILLDASLYPSSGYAAAVDEQGQVFSAGAICSNAACASTRMLVRSTVPAGNASVSRALDPSPGGDQAYALEASGGKLLVAGQAGSQLVVLQLDSGTLAPDPSFGVGGTYLLRQGPGTFARANAVARQPDGKIVVAGSYFANQSDDGQILVARLLPEGRPDPSFGDDGVVTVNYTDMEDYANSVLVQPDGKIVVGGTATPEGRSSLALLRLDAQGQPDRSFGSAGLAVAGFDGPAYGYDLALLPDGGFTVVGYTVVDGRQQPALARFVRTGALDPTFSADGKATLAFGSAEEQLYAIASTGPYTYIAGAATYQVSNSVSVVALLQSTGRANRAADVSDEEYRTRAETPLQVLAPGVLANDRDPDGDSLSAVLIAAPSNGTLSLMPHGGFIYRPVPGFSGLDSFTYRANDGIADSHTATVTIAVEPPGGNQAPAARGDRFSAAADTALRIMAPGVLVNDEDPEGGALRAELASPPANGRLELDRDGGMIYLPNPGFSGEDRFAYRAVDRFDRSAPVEVVIAVAPPGADAPPNAMGDQYSVAAGELLEIPAAGVLANDADPNGEPIRAELLLAPSTGSLSLGADGALRYQAAPGAGGVVRFTYRAVAGGLASEPATVTIQVGAGQGQSPTYRLHLPLLRR